MSKWIEITLGDAITLQRGFDLPMQSRQLGNIPIVASTGIAGCHDEFKVNAPGVVIGRSGSIGGAQLITSNFWPLNTTLWVKDFKGNYPNFIYYLLLNIDFSFLNAGSGVPTLNRNHIYPLPVLLPPLPTQRRIAEIMGRLDDKIEVNWHINRTLETMAQALFKHWFVDFGPFQDGEFVESELGLIPKGWNTRSLYDCAQYINGAAYKNIDFSSDQSGLPVIKIAELKNGITAQTKFTNKELPPKYRLSNGDILFSWSGSPETSLNTFIWTCGPAWLNQHIFKVIPYRQVERGFLYFLLRYFKQTFIEIARNKQTTGLGHVTVKDMENLQVVLPTNTILEEFEKLAGPIFDRIFYSQLEIQKLTTTRDYLLSKLLNGEIEV